MKVEISPQRCLEIVNLDRTNQWLIKHGVTIFVSFIVLTPLIFVEIVVGNPDPTWSAF